jgi:hypothetical protein
LIAKALGDVDVQQVWRVLRAQKIDLAARKSWCESNDPEFAAKAAEVVGLYMAPPENAIVISVDEKPSIQALERRQGYLKMPNGRALTGQSHDYKRHGTTTLFAALNVATGQVSGRQYKRRRRVEFLDFMNRVVAEHPGRELHVILDNLNTHKPKNDRWLKRHPNVHFHFTPTKASWLNQACPREGGDRNLVLDPGGQGAFGHVLQQPEGIDGPHQCLHRRLQCRCKAVRVDQIPGSSKVPQAMFRGLAIPGTRPARLSNGSEGCPPIGLQFRPPSGVRCPAVNACVR